MGSVTQTGIALRKLILGNKVDRAAATFVAALTPIFTITGGRVLMTSFFGTMTVAGGTNAVHIEATPTTGASQPIAANLDVDAMIVGDTCTINGKADGAMTYNASTVGLQSMCYGPVILNVGTLDYHAAATEGAMKWSMTYIPLDDGAYVTAVA
jgi:hypothetical protein